jgi:Serine/threonine protein kinase
VFKTFELCVVQALNVIMFSPLFPASHLFRQVVQGLLYLHSHNILHRDISLANLLLTKDMRVVSITYLYYYIKHI